MNLQEIKTELNKLTEQIAKLEQEKPAYSFTKEELIKLIKAVQEQTMEHVGKEIKDIDLQFEDYVELELCDKEIVVNFDNYAMARDISDNIQDPDEVSDDDIENLLIDLQK